VRRGPAIVLSGLAVIFVIVIVAALAAGGGGDDEEPTDEGPFNLASIPTAALPEVTPETILVTNEFDATSTSQPNGNGNGNCDEEEYVVIEGDYPFLIAENHGITIDELYAANPTFDWNNLQPGDSVQIPCPPTPEPTEEPDSTGTPGGDEPDGTATPVDTVEYEIVSGDIPIAVAERYNLTLEELAELNDMSVDEFIAKFATIGEIILVPAE
jgi:LysM repeat protein